MAIIDFTGDPNEKQGTGGYSLLPGGYYDMRIAEVEAQPAKGDKGPQLLIKCVILASDESPETVNRTITMWQKCERAADMRRICDAAGVPWTPTVGKDGKPGIRFDSDHLVNGIIRGLCKHSKPSGTNGKQYENWYELTRSRYAPDTQGVPVGQPLPAVATPAPAIQAPVIQAPIPVAAPVAAAPALVAPTAPVMVAPVLTQAMTAPPVTGAVPPQAVAPVLTQPGNSVPQG